MNTFRVVCPLCSVVLKVSRDLSGKLSDCPGCKRTIRVPHAGELEASAPVPRFETVGPRDVIDRVRRTSQGEISLAQPVAFGLRVAAVVFGMWGCYAFWEVCRSEVRFLKGYQVVAVLGLTASLAATVPLVLLSLAEVVLLLSRLDRKGK